MFMIIPKNIQQIKDGVYKRISRIVKKRAKEKLMAHTALWNTIEQYSLKSGSTGADYTDYLALYTYIRLKKPVEVLECGTGVTTIVMAFAMKENYEETGKKGRITSMDDVEEWYVHAKELLPSEFASYVDLQYSPSIIDAYSIFRGTRYSHVPDRPYEFVFTDGPSYTKNEEVLCNLDYFFVVQRSEHPVSGLIDKRLSTCVVYAHIFGKNKFFIDYFCGLGVCLPVSKHDIRVTNDIGRSYCLRDRIPSFRSAFQLWKG